VRFAPSPTGDLHVGGVRSALFTWLFTRKHGGDFILRIEDTDRNRYKEESVQSITGALRWIGLDWDEGPEVGGPHAPYFQSERLPIYQEHAWQLVKNGHAYECFCSSERLDALRKDQIARKQPPGYDRHCRNLTEEERAARRAEGITPVIRFKVPEDGATTVHDELRGDITYENRVLEDAVLLKSDGFPTYHLAATVDDEVMGITHVMRGEEWLPSFPLHVLIRHAFGWEVPPYYHLPVILGPEGGKLSKRRGAVGTLQYKAEGYLPEALRNYLVLQGWSYNDHEEIFPTLEELIEKFSIERVNPSPSKYNFDKVLWFNQYYVNHIIDLDDLTRRSLPRLQEAGLVGDVQEGSPEYDHVREAIGLIKDKMKLLSEVADLTRFFFTGPDPYETDLLIPKKTEPGAVVEALRQSRAIIAESGVDNEEALESTLRQLADQLGLKAGQLFMPIRVAITGRTVSPGLFDTLRVIGLEQSLARIDAAIAKMG
jgi:glutamyl-tRNA synthetase